MNIRDVISEVNFHLILPEKMCISLQVISHGFAPTPAPEYLLEYEGTSSQLSEDERVRMTSVQDIFSRQEFLPMSATTRPWNDLYRSVILSYAILNPGSQYVGAHELGEAATFVDKLLTKYTFQLRSYINRRGNRSLIGVRLSEPQLISIMSEEYLRELRQVEMREPGMFYFVHSS